MTVQEKGDLLIQTTA